MKKKESNRQFTQRIKGLYETIKHLSHEIKTKVRAVNYLCEKKINYSDGIVEYVTKDGIVISTSPISDEDRQLELPIANVLELPPHEDSEENKEGQEVEESGTEVVEEENPKSSEDSTKKSKKGKKS